MCDRLRDAWSRPILSTPLSRRSAQWQDDCSPNRALFAYRPSNNTGLGSQIVSFGGHIAHAMHANRHVVLKATNTPVALWRSLLLPTECGTRPSAASEAQAERTARRHGEPIHWSDALGKDARSWRAAVVEYVLRAAAPAVLDAACEMQRKLFDGREPEGTLSARRHPRSSRLVGVHMRWGDKVYVIYIEI